MRRRENVYANNSRYKCGYSITYMHTYIRKLIKEPFLDLADVYENDGDADSASIPTGNNTGQCLMNVWVWRLARFMEFKSEYPYKQSYTVFFVHVLSDAIVI